MSTRLTVPNGLYCDAWPSGEYACLMADLQRVQTHLGVIAVATAAPLYVRLTVTPRFKFAGQGWPTANPKDAWVQWDETWALGDTTAFGVSPCIYTLDGGLVVATPAQGTQGYRYVDPVTGQLFTGDETYYSPAYGLAEWSGLGDGLFIGQSPTDGLDHALLWDGSKHRLLEPGPCRFIRTNRVGPQVSIAMIKSNGGPSVIYWMTVAELRALPVYPPEPPPQRTDVAALLSHSHR